MKKLLNLILVMILLVATVSFSLNTFVEEVSKLVSTSLIQNELEKQLNRVVDEVQTIIPFDDHGAVDKLMVVLKEDPKVNEAIDKYAKQFIHDLAQSNDNFAIDMNEEIQTLILNHSEEFGGLLGDIINPTYKEAIIKEVVKRIDFNDYYIKGIKLVKSKLTPAQLNMMSGVNTVFENTHVYKQISLISGFVSTMLLVIVNKFKLRALGLALVLSGLAHFVLTALLPWMIKMKVPQFSDIFSFDLFIRNGILFTVMGIVFITINGIQERRETV